MLAANRVLTRPGVQYFAKIPNCFITTFEDEQRWAVKRYTSVLLALVSRSGILFDARRIHLLNLQQPLHDVRMIGSEVLGFRFVLLEVR